MKKIRGFWEGVADAFSFSMMLIVVMMIMTLLLAGCSSAPSGMPTRNRSDVVAALNTYRIGHGLQGVTTNPRLDLLADERAQHAWRYRNGNLADGHSGFNSAVDRSGVPGAWFGENLYAGPFQPTAKETVNAWHASEPHKKMMQRRTTDECGAAETYDGKKSVVALLCVDKRVKDWL